MRQKIYQIMVNKYPGISSRYHRMHDGAEGIQKIGSWLYLIWLNLAYHVFRIKKLGMPIGIAAYEEKHLPLRQSESQQNYITIMEQVDEIITKYDVISFDIFDTLIFRPFSEPTDVFYFVGKEFDYMDFKRIRMQAESEMRWQRFQEAGSFEVTLQDIWRRLEKMTGIPAEKGMETEWRYELEFCYANPYMKAVYEKLSKAGKKIILISDMYLPKILLEQILKKNGYTGYRELFVSCEYDKCKGDAKLFEYAKEKIGTQLKYVHIGDNEHSDVKMAQKAGFDALYYPNVNKNALTYRAYDMSPVIGGAYRGIVNNHIYCGDKQYSMPYEYGFTYGGLFILGYCNYIHEYCEKEKIDKILFLARDGQIIQKAYELLYPDEKTEYVYWSRLASTKLSAKYYPYDYFRRFLLHKVNQNYSIERIMTSMELTPLLERLPEGMKMTDHLTDRNVGRLRQFLQENWKTVLEIYEPQQEAAKKWYSERVGDARRTVAVDIGWAGSGAIVLDCLFQKEWKLPCECIGLVAGTNTVHNFEPDATEMFFQTGKLNSYLYSFSKNRDLLKLHDPNKDFNIYWELLTSSPQPSFKGFYWKDERKTEVELAFVKKEKNPEGIEKIQRGILDFVREYQMHFGREAYMYHISGRDAYAPMVVAASYQCAYLKEIEKQFGLEIGVGN